MKDFFIEFSNLVQINYDRNGWCHKNNSSVVVILLIGPEWDTEKNEHVQGPEYLAYKENQNIGPVNDHGSRAERFPDFVCFLIGQSLMGVFEDVGDFLTIVEINCIYNPVINEILHVPVDKSNDFVGLFLVHVLNHILFFYYRVLIVVVEDVKMGCLIDSAATVVE